MSEKYAKLEAARTQLHSLKSDYYFPPWPWERGSEGGRRGAEKTNKQSEQRQPLRKKGVQSEGKGGEKRSGKAGKGVG